MKTSRSMSTNSSVRGFLSKRTAIEPGVSFINAKPFTPENRPKPSLSSPIAENGDLTGPERRILKALGERLAESIAIAVIGAIVGAAAMMKIVSNEVQARNAQVTDSIDGAEQQTRQTNDLALKTVAAWQQRAETCEAKFSVATVVYQNQAIATVPLLHGMIALKVAPGGGSAQPSLVIPAQVEVYSQRPDIQYQWLDGRTGEPKSIIQPAKANLQ